jgi:hypothetical protein
MRSGVLGLLVAIGLALAGTGEAGAVSTPPVDAKRCFFIQSFQNWKAPDNKTIYIRVNLNQYYRLDLANRCSNLNWPDSRLITQWRGSSSVCSGLDWDLKVAQGGVRGFAMPCIVKTMTPLTAVQALTIPKKFRP